MQNRLDDLPLAKKGLIVACVPALVASLFIILLGVMLFESQQQAKREKQTREILFAVQRIAPMSSEALNAVTTYNWFKDQNSEIQLKAIVKKQEKELARLEEILKDFPDLKSQGQSWINVVKRERLTVIAIYELSGNPATGLFASAGFKRQIQSLFPFEFSVRREFVKQLTLRQLESQRKSQQLNIQVIKIIPIALIVNVLIGLLLAIYYAKSINRRLGMLTDNAARLASAKSLMPRQLAHDEIGRLDSAFHRMALELSEAAANEKAIVENAADVICSLSDEAVFHTVNPRVERAWGYSSSDLINKSLFEVIHPDDRERVQVQLSAIAKGSPEGSFECRLITRDEIVIHIRWSVNWLDEEGRFYCVAHDITERKLEEALIRENEQLLKLVIESMPLGLFITNLSDEIELTNLSSKHMLGYRESEIKDRPIQTILAKPDGQLEKHFLNKLHDTIVDGSFELSVRRKDGEDFPVELTISDFTMEGQKRVLVVMQDITLRREVERLKKDFVAMVSHDLRTPLSTVLGSLNILQTGALGKLNSEGELKITVAEEETERLIGLVNTLLDIEKFEAGQMDLHKEICDIKELIEHVVLALILQAEEREVNLIARAEPIRIPLDRSAITQVLINLIGNAIKFSPAKSTIDVSSTLDGDYLEIKIKDEGRGIPPSHLTQIFERFKQVELSDRTEKKGSGLGLAICKSIVEAHDGTIGVESRFGEGSTFWFKIPLSNPVLP